jgi:hypothetical protein
MSESVQKVRESIDKLLSKAAADDDLELLRKIEGNLSFGFLKLIFLFSALVRDEVNKDKSVTKKPKIR